MIKKLKHKGTKSVILFLLAILVAITFLFVFGACSDDSQETPVDVELQDRYIIGNILEFPKKDIEIDGVSYETETILHYPDGSIKRCNSVRFSETGLYSLEYRKVVAGKVYNKTYDFSVVEKTFSINSSSKAEYKIDDSQYNTGINGIWLDLSNGGYFNYNKIVDLSLLDNKEPAISLFVLPKTQGLRDFTDLIITFTDAYDSSNKVIVQINCYYMPSRQGVSEWSEHAAMYFAGTSEAALYGYRYDVNTGGNYKKADGRENNIQPRWGYETKFSFSGGWHTGMNRTGDWNSTVGQEFLTVAFDLEKGYVLGPDNGSAASRIGMEEPLLVADLTDDMVYSSAWKGFTTGEVYISIKGAGYISPSAEIMINKIGRENLSEEYFTGKTKPNIYVDTEGYSESELPVAKVGSAYTLFKGSGTDCFNGSYEILPRVFYQYGYDTCWEIDVENGAFKPDRSGTYTLVYSVRDGYGTVAEKRLDVKAVDELSEISIDKSGVVINGKTGLNIPVCEAQAIGGSGNLDISVAVKYDTEDIAVSDGYIKPLKSGEYTVNITATDWLGTVKRDFYTLTVVENGNLVSESDIVIPKYFIEGKKYLLPDCAFFDYRSDGTILTVASKIEIIDADGTHDLDSREYTVKGDGGVVKVRYYATLGSKSISLPIKEVPVINVSSGTGIIDLSKYFETDNLTAIRETGGIAFNCEFDGSFKFIKTLVADKFSVDFRIVKDKSDFGLLEFYLEDSENAAEEIKISFVKLFGGSINVFVNDKKVVGSLSTTFINDIMSNISYAGGILSVNGTEIRVALRTYSNGSTFEGFSSGKVYFRAEMKNVSSMSAVLIKSIGNQPFVSSIIDGEIKPVQDKIKPEFAVMKEYSMVNALGSVVEICDIYADDILDTFITKTLTVKDPSGETMKSKDGVVLDGVECRKYSIALDSYGSYKITYTVSDSSGNIERYTITIGVYDLIKPEINIDGNVVKTAKVGDAISLPNVVITDNYSINPTYTVMIVNPLFVEKVYTEGMKFDMVGKYTINFIAYDDAGNMTIMSYNVNVQKG